MDINSKYINFSLDKNRILLVALFGEDHAFSGESAGVNSISGYMRYFYPGIEIDILDMQIDPLISVVEYINHYRPAVLGISVKLKSYNQLNQLKLLLSSKVSADVMPIIVLGNAIPAYSYEKLCDEGWKDCIFCVGEGELTIEDVYNSIQNQSGFENVRNAVMVDSKDRLVKNQFQLVPEERIAIPDRRRSLEFYQKGGIVYLETSRGCPWRSCTICSGSQLFNNSNTFMHWRPIPLEVALSDFDLVQNLGIEIVRITDEDFLGRSILGIRRAKQFAEEKMKRKNKVKFDIMVRVDSICNHQDTIEEKLEREEAIELLKQAGLVQIFMGVESFSASQLKRYNKGISLDEIYNAYDVLRRLQIPINIGFIPCDPLMDLCELKETMYGLPKDDALLEVSVSFHELRVQEGTKYLYLLRGEEKKLETSLIGDIDKNSLTYPVIKYLDPQVDLYVQGLRSFYNGTNYYRIVFLLRTYLQYSRFNVEENTHLLIDNCLEALKHIRGLDYDLSISIIDLLNGKDDFDQKKSMLEKLVDRTQRQLALHLLDLACKIQNSIGLKALGKNGLIPSLIQEIIQFANITRLVECTEHKTIDSMKNYIDLVQNEISPLLSKLKMGTKIAQNNHLLLSGVIERLLFEMSLGDRIAVMMYGSSGGKFLVSNSDTDFIFLSDGTIPDEDILRFQERVYFEVDNRPWKVTVKDWKRAKPNPMDLRSICFVGGNRRIFDEQVIYNHEIMETNNEKVLISTLANFDLYAEFYSSTRFSRLLATLHSSKEIPGEIGYGELKYFFGGTRVAQAVLSSVAFYMKKRFLADVNLNDLATADIFTHDECKDLIHAIDFFLCAKDLCFEGNNIFHPGNQEKIQAVWGQSEKEIGDEYEHHRVNILRLFQKARERIIKDFPGSTGVRCRIETDPGILMGLINSDDYEFWKTFALRKDLPVEVRNYLEKKVLDRKKEHPHTMLDEIIRMLEYSKLENQSNEIQRTPKINEVEIELGLTDYVFNHLEMVLKNNINAPDLIRLAIHSMFFDLYKASNNPDLYPFISAFKGRVKNFFHCRTYEPEQPMEVAENVCAQILQSGLFHPESVFFLELHPTNLCNLKCAWCTYRSKDERQSILFEDLRKVIALAPNEILIAGGGEPTLYRDGDYGFNEVVRFLRGNLPGTRIRLITNGTNVPRGTWFNELDEISVSLDENNREAFLTAKGKDLFDAVWKNIQFYLYNTSISTIRVTKIYNHKNLFDSIELAENLFILWKRIPQYSTKKTYFKFMLFPMANDLEQESPYSESSLSAQEKFAWIGVMEKIRTEKAVFYDFLKNNTNLINIAENNPGVIRADRCWPASQFVLLGADRLFYPCFTTCSTFKAINYGTVDQSIESLTELRKNIFSTPPLQCQDGCRPGSVFSGLRAKQIHQDQLSLHLPTL